VTLAVVFKGPEGIVLAADSRVTLTVPVPGGMIPGTKTPGVMAAFFDNATKMLSIQGQPYVGIVTSGVGAIGQREPRTAHGYVPEFEAQLARECPERTNIVDIATELGKFYQDQWAKAGMPKTAGLSMQFLVAGFDPGAPYGRVFKIVVPDAPAPVEQVANDFGITVDGQNELVGRLLHGADPRAAQIAKDSLSLDDSQVKELDQKWREGLSLPIPFQFLPLQDCVDLCAFLVNMTSAVQSWTTGLRGVGGDVDVATITRTEGFRAIKQKKIQVWGESDD
jgi:hypothetical protein